MSDDRPKKSWREIDKSREKAQERRDPDQRERSKIEKTAAYSKYKDNLDKLFTPGGNALPESLKSKLGPVSAEAAEKRKLTDALKATPNAETLKAMLEAKIELPPDARLMMSLLEIKDEALLVPVLETLLAAIKAGPKPSKALLTQKLTMLEGALEEPATKKLVAEIRAAL
jgi:hypothetical protein